MFNRASVELARPLTPFVKQERVRFRSSTAEPGVAVFVDEGVVGEVGVGVADAVEGFGLAGGEGFVGVERPGAFEEALAAGADGVILGCTEIGLLISQADLDHPVFDTTALHAAAALDFALSA